MLILILSALMACDVQVNRHSKPVEVSRAEEAGEEFMSHAINSESDEAFRMMEREFRDVSNTTEMKNSLDKFLEECGHPDGYTLKHRETGWKVYGNGQRRPTVKLFYVMTTALHPEEKCIFSVEIAANDDQLAVTGFGPLKSVFGQLPKWAEDQSSPK